MNRKCYITITASLLKLKSFRYLVVIRQLEKFRGKLVYGVTTERSFHSYQELKLWLDIMNLKKSEFKRADIENYGGIILESYVMM